MFLLRKKSKGKTYYYIAAKKRVGSQSKTFIVRRLGEEAELLAADPGFLEKAKKELEGLNADIAEDRACVTRVLDPSKKSSAKAFHAGMFPVFAEMAKCGMYEDISSCIGESRDSFDTARITADLIAERIISPASKLLSHRRISENPLYGAKYSKDDVYRSLSRLDASIDAIQAAMLKRKDPEDCDIVFYDTTNFYFEIEEATEGLRQYGISKEHRPNPIVQMGLFMSGSGQPLWCNTNPGNAAECTTVIPSAKQMSKAGISSYVYCADAGIGSGRIKAFNSGAARRYVIAQSLKKLDSASMEWALSDEGWCLTENGSTKTGLKKKDCPKKGFLWKELLRKLTVTMKDEKGKTMKYDIPERLIVTYSDSSFRWEGHRLDTKIKRALASLRTSRETNPNSTSTVTSSIVVDCNDEVIEDATVLRALDQGKIEAERRFHGLYAVVTNLPASVHATGALAINSKRYQIEDYFREMKSTLLTRPIHLSTDEHIRAHIFICHLAVMVMMGMNARLRKKGKECSPSKLKAAIEGMLLREYPAVGYEPCHVGTSEVSEIRETLERIYGQECLEMELVSEKKMKKLKKILG